MGDKLASLDAIAKRDRATKETASGLLIGLHLRNTFSDPVAFRFRESGCNDAIRSTVKQDNQSRKVLIEVYWHYGKRLEMLPLEEKASFRLECCLSPERTRAANAVATLTAKELADILAKEEPPSISELMGRKGHDHTKRKTTKSARGKKVPAHDAVTFTITGAQAAFLKMLLIDREEREAQEILEVLGSDEDPDDGLEDLAALGTAPPIDEAPSPITSEDDDDDDLGNWGTPKAEQPAVVEPIIIVEVEPVILKKAGKHNGMVIRPRQDVWAEENAKRAVMVTA